MRTIAEVWADVPGYEGMYQVSDRGRMKSLDRLNSRGHRIKGRMLRTPLDYKGYPSIALSKGGKGSSVRVHRIVMAAFKGPAPEGLEVCHNDGNRANNNLENLRYDTHQANMDDKYRHGSVSRPTECKNGHPFSGDNLYVDPSRGWQGCRTCRRETSRRHNRKLRAGARS